MLSKTEILATVDTIASQRLFVDRKWFVDPKTASSLYTAIGELGLIEPAPNNGTKLTTLGKELNIDLQVVFMGLWDPWDAIGILKDQNLVTENEVGALYDLLEADERHYEPLLRARVQQAYRDYHKAKRLH